MKEIEEEDEREKRGKEKEGEGEGDGEGGEELQEFEEENKEKKQKEEEKKEEENASILLSVPRDTFLPGFGNNLPLEFNAYGVLSRRDSTYFPSSSSSFEAGAVFGADLHHVMEHQGYYFFSFI